MKRITIRFDGGCSPNPGEKYGSFEVSLDGRQIALVSRMSLGHGTNNEAEFEIFEAALKWTRQSLFEAGNSPAQFDLEAFSDSTIVVNRLTGKNRTEKTSAQKRMSTCMVKCLNLTKTFNSFKIKWNGRINNVRIFGH